MKYTTTVTIRQTYEVEADNPGEAKELTIEHLIHSGFLTQNIISEEWSVSGVKEGWSEIGTDHPEYVINGEKLPDPTQTFDLLSRNDN